MTDSSASGNASNAPWDIHNQSVEKSKIFPEPPKNSGTVRDFNESNPYFHILNMVVDPEVGVGIVDMGLIYHVEEHDGVVMVTMTLTSMGCPAGPQLTTDVDAVLRMQEGVKDVEIEVVWDPAWNPDMMNPDIKQMLFGG